MDFDAFVVARREGLVRSAVLMGCPEADAEDVVQAALLRCYRHWRRVQRAETPEAYVYKILVNVLRQAKNRRWHGELPTEHLPDVVFDSEAATGLMVRAVLAAYATRAPGCVGVALLRRPLRSRHRGDPWRADRHREEPGFAGLFKR